MGEPQKGDYVDNIFLSKQQIKLKGGISGSKGDILVPENATTGIWVLASADDVDVSNGFAMAYVDFDTTGFSDGEIVIEACTAPTYIYAEMGEAITPNARVKFDGTTQKFVLAAAADLAAGYVVGRFSRLSTDQAGNNPSADTDIGIIKLGVL